jgi:hypothetical protein
MGAAGFKGIEGTTTGVAIKGAVAAGCAGTFCGADGETPAGVCGVAVLTGAATVGAGCWTV